VAFVVANSGEIYLIAVVADLDDVSTLQGDDLVGVADGGQPIGDDQSRAASAPHLMLAGSDTRPRRLATRSPHPGSGCTGRPALRLSSFVKGLFFLPEMSVKVT
jgi:hypothetical protein